MELERKEGCSLRGFSAPLLLLAIKMLLEEKTLSQVSAQGIYNEVCGQMGIQASALAFESVGAANIAMANSSKTAGIGNGLKRGLTGQMKGQGTGMNKLFGKLAGLGKVKIAAIVTGTVVAAGAATATGVYVYHQNQTQETQAQAVQEKKEKAE